jgi:hypothetical protein
MLQLSVRQPDWQKAIQDLAVAEREKIRLVLESVGAETIAHLKSITDERRPPARGTLGERFAHPGHWADVTGVLANSYGWEIQPTENGWRLILSNTAEYAIHLEARHGFFVLTGVADPGGPVEEALKDVASKIAPSWSVSALPRGG